MKCSITWLYWFVGITIFCIDRITKNAALALFVDRVYSEIPCLSYEMTINRGISWGMFHSSDQIVFIGVSLVQVIMTVLVAWSAYMSYKRGEIIFGHVCVIVGALSNLIDRCFYNGVIDFIIFSFRDYSWPVFNIADMAIVIGVGIIVWQHSGLHKII